jgi:hypothetical protein
MVWRLTFFVVLGVFCLSVVSFLYGIQTRKRFFYAVGTDLISFHSAAIAGGEMISARDAPEQNNHNSSSVGPLAEQKNGTEGTPPTESPQQHAPRKNEIVRAQQNVSVGNSTHHHVGQNSSVLTPPPPASSNHNGQAL